MLKRLNIYFKEMYPIIPRLFLGMLVFLEIYFIVFCNSGGTIQDITAMPWKNFAGMAVCGFTIFSFLCWLRIADDFKDYELDCRLFAHRPLPSGRVTKNGVTLGTKVLTGVLTAANVSQSSLSVLGEDE